MRTLLLGMGNVLLTDDAIGVRLATEIKRRIGPFPELDVVEECAVGGLNLIDVVSGYDRLIVIDAMCSGGKPATWCHFDGDALVHTLHLSSIHDANFATAMELGRRLGARLPEPQDIHIFAVEVSDVVTFSEQMSEVLTQAMPELVEEILADVRAVLDVS